jgi:WD40 repeat protein
MNERELFEAALDHEPGDRAAFLDRVCAGAPAVRERLEALLARQEQAGSFLEGAAWGEGNHQVEISKAPTMSSSAELTGKVLAGRYKLLEQIGEGGFAVVFMAEQQEPIRRKVALKILKPGMDTKQVIARFEAERQALALMDHPSIAHVLDAGQTAGGRPYFVMDLVKGLPITEFCDQGQLTPKERLELFVHVCQAVQHAHQKGIIHRDLKPSNVLVTLHDGAPLAKVIDFGIAKALGQQLTDKTIFTSFAQMIGTPLYMSPEQASLSDGDVDTRSDIYSLGVLLYELLTGTTPFDKEGLSKAGYDEMRRILREEEPLRPSTRISTMGQAATPMSARRQSDPRRLSQLFRGELDWIVMKALEKDRNRRYETANSLAADVQRFLHDEPVLACPPSAWYRLRKMARRHRWALALAGVLFAALLVIAAGSLVAALFLNEALQDSEGHRIRAEGAEETSRQAEKVATERLYGSVVAQARSSRLSRRMGQRFNTLDTLAEAAKIAQKLNIFPVHALELRNETVAALALADVRVAKEWDGWPVGSMTIDFDNAFERYARVDRQGVVHIHRVADGSEIWQLTGFGAGNFGGEETHPQFSPDGRFLVLTRNRPQHQLKLWSLGGPEPVLIPLQAPSLCTGRVFSPDSRELVLVRRDGSAHLYELPSGRELKRLEGTGNSGYGNLAYHPKARQLAMSHASGVQIRDLATGNVLADLPVAEGSYYIAWHPQGKILAVCERDRIQHWDVATRLPMVRLEGRAESNFTFAFNHTGNLIVGTGWDRTLHLWDTRSGRQLFSTRSSVGCLRFSPDDQVLAAGCDSDNRKLRLWQVALPLGHRELVRVPVRNAEGYASPTVSPKERILAVTTGNGVGLWDLATGTQLGFLELGNSQCLFEPSGALLTCQARHGPTDVLRWPVQRDSAESGLLRIGPAEKLPVPGGGLALSQDGSALAIGASRFTGERGWIWRPKACRPLTRLKEFHKDPRYISISPRGQWVATGSFWGTKVKISDAYTGDLVHELPVEETSPVLFSPDNRWLATDGGGCRLWTVGSWRQGPNIGGACRAFSPDGAMMAVETGHGVVRLVDPGSGRDYVRLEDANQALAGNACFSTDGARLIIANGESNSIQIWDLRLIRQELAKMDLDWDLPGFPSEPPGGSSTLGGPPLRVVVDLVSWQDKGAALVDLRQWDQAAAAFDKALELEPNNPRLWLETAYLRLRTGDTEGYRKLCAHMLERFGKSTNVQEIAHLAHTCALAPQALADVTRVPKLAERALALRPASTGQDPWHVHILGLAHYRAGENDRTVACLERSLKQNEGWRYNMLLNTLVLAMAHQRLMHAAEARQWLDKARQGIDQENRNRPEKGGRFAPPGWNWWDWIGVDLLHREAQTLIDGKGNVNATKAKR